MGKPTLTTPPWRRGNGTVLLRRDGSVVIDEDDAESLLIRKNGDAGDVFVVDTSNSRVGIGTGTPLVPTHLKAGNGELLRIEGDTGTSAKYFTLREGAVNRMTIGLDADAGGSIVSNSLGDSVVIQGTTAVHVTATGDASDGITVTSSGRLGVKTTTPTVEAEVNGTLKATTVQTGDLQLKNKALGVDLVLRESAEHLLILEDRNTGKLYRLSLEEVGNA